MPAFDVTANPTTLTVKPGEKQTIVVTVTNRLGRPVTGRAILNVNPTSGAAWIKLPPDPQRVFTQPNATQEYRFGLEVPATATPGVYQVRIDVVDIELPDDNFGQSQTIAVTVPTVAVPVPVVKPRFPWWIWLVAGVVVIGAGVTIWKLTSSGGEPVEACAPTFPTAGANTGEILLVSSTPDGRGARVYLNDKCQGMLQTRRLRTPGITTSSNNPTLLLAHVPAGTYTISIRKSGFQDVKRDVTVVPGQRVPVNFDLRP
jgi:hypothetical protein